MGIVFFSEVEELFKSRGVETLYIKRLALKQDNEKNQIYFGSGGGINSIVNLFPGSLSYGLPSESQKKRKSNAGRPKIIANLEFYWLFRDGSSFHAPHTKIINYFQYPEARMSGFLKSCKQAPRAIRREEQGMYGGRILILGANAGGKTFGLLLNAREDPLLAKFPEFEALESIPILSTHVIGLSVGAMPKDQLVKDLRGLAGKWHPSVILKNSIAGPEAFKGNQGAGYTLEALLGVVANSSKEPDKYGFEVKSFKAGGKISLMTPTADLGAEGDLTFRDFMAQYGWMGKKGDGRRVFNGVFRYKKPNPTRKHFIDIFGYDNVLSTFNDELNTIEVCLLNKSITGVISGWSFEKLLDGWSKKHMAACYVEYEKKPFLENGHDAKYRFTGRVFICEQTTIFRYLEAIARDHVYYDPGHEIKASGKADVRPQWRLSVTKSIGKKLQDLYERVHEIQM